MWMIFNELCFVPKTNTGYALNLRAGEETKFHLGKWNSGRDLNAEILCWWSSQSYESHNTTIWNAEHESMIMQMKYEMQMETER